VNAKRIYRFYTKDGLAVWTKVRMRPGLDSECVRSAGNSNQQSPLSISKPLSQHFA